MSISKETILKKFSELREKMSKSPLEKKIVFHLHFLDRYEKEYEKFVKEY